MRSERLISSLRGGPLVLAVLLLSCTLPAFSAAPSPAVTQVESVAMTVQDMDRAVDFYTRVLTFEKVSDHEVSGDGYEHLWGVFGLRLRAVRMRLGEEHIELMQFLAPRGRPIPADSRSNDRWFQHVAIIVSDMDAGLRAAAQLQGRACLERAAALPDWNPNAGGIKAFYFRDPDGNHLEILRVSAGQGRWRNGTTPADDAVHGHRSHRDRRRATRSEPAFLSGHLGHARGGHERELRHRAGASEQRVRRASRASPRCAHAHGPGIELLEYLAPRGGRPMPADTQAQRRLVLADQLCAATIAAGDRIRRDRLSNCLSPDVPRRARLPRGVILEDPDGHASLIARSERHVQEPRHHRRRLRRHQGCAGLEHTLPPDWTLTLDQPGELHHFQPAAARSRGRLDSARPRDRAPSADDPLQSRLHGAGHRDRYRRNASFTISAKARARLHYDQLVLACGTNANLDIVKGMAQTRFAVEDARRCAVPAQPDHLRAWSRPSCSRIASSAAGCSTFVVVGGGFSGVETAGELVDFLYASLKYYKRIRREDLRIVLLHSGDRLLPELSASLGEFTVARCAREASTCGSTRAPCA